jgi:hypothetical protein
VSIEKVLPGLEQFMLFISILKIQLAKKSWVGCVPSKTLMAERFVKKV